MARLNTNLEVIKQVTKVGFIRDLASAVDTTIDDAAVSAGDLTIQVPSAAAGNLSADDLIRIGSGDLLEENVVASVSTDIVTLKLPLAYDHAIGEEVVSRVRVDIGEPTEDGVTLRSTADLVNIGIATSFRPYVRLLRGAEYFMEWALRNFSLENFAAAAGIPESNVTGSTTDGSPLVVRMTDTTLVSEANLTMYVWGLRQDSTTFEVQVWAVEMDPSQELNLRSGEGSPIRMNGSGKNISITRPRLPA